MLDFASHEKAMHSHLFSLPSLSPVHRQTLGWGKCSLYIGCQDRRCCFFPHNWSGQMAADSEWDEGRELEKRAGPHRAGLGAGERSKQYWKRKWGGWNIFCVWILHGLYHSWLLLSFLHSTSPSTLRTHKIESAQARGCQGHGIPSNPVWLWEKTPKALCSAPGLTYLFTECQHCTVICVPGAGAVLKGEWTCFLLLLGIQSGGGILQWNSSKSLVTSVSPAIPALS